MRTILVSVALFFTACADLATLSSAPDAAPDAYNEAPAIVPLDAGRPLCPGLWGPGSDIRGCGQLANGGDCFESAERVEFLPCRYDSGGVVLLATGMPCAACEAAR